MNAGDRQIALAVHGAHAAKRGPGNRRAMIGVAARDDRLLGGFAHQVPIDPHHAQDRVVGVRTGTTIENHVHVVRRNLGNHLRDLDDWRMRGLEKGVVVAQFHHLRPHCIGNLGAAMADIDAPQPGHAVHDAVAVRIPQPDAIGARDDTSLVNAQRTVIGEGMEVVLVIGNLEIVRGHVDEHVELSRCAVRRLLFDV